MTAYDTSELSRRLKAERSAVSGDAAAWQWPCRMSAPSRADREPTDDELTLVLRILGLVAPAPAADRHVNGSAA